MTNQFFEKPILNSPYAQPARHWELDADGQPTQQIIEVRRRTELITPIPKPRKRKSKAAQPGLDLDDRTGVSTADQRYDPHARYQRPAAHRRCVALAAESPRLACHAGDGAAAAALAQSRVPEHPALPLPGGGRRNGELADRGCARHRAGPQVPRTPGERQLRIASRSDAPRPRRRPNRRRFTKGLLVASPGITIRDRLQVLQLNDSDGHYRR